LAIEGGPGRFTEARTREADEDAFAGVDQFQAVDPEVIAGEPALHVLEDLRSPLCGR
jgi:hypothetical protein